MITHCDKCGHEYDTEIVYIYETSDLTFCEWCFLSDRGTTEIDFQRAIYFLEKRNVARVGEQTGYEYRAFQLFRNAIYEAYEEYIKSKEADAQAEREAYINS